MSDNDQVIVGWMKTIDGHIEEARKSYDDLRQIVVSKTECSNCKKNFVDKRWAAGVIVGVGGFYAVISFIAGKVPEAAGWVQKATGQ